MDRRILLLKLDEHDATPMYMQLARKLTSAIESGQWQAGEALPSERTLTETLGISRVTARRALKVLSDDGTVSKNRGTGTFITPRFHQSLSKLFSFSDMVRPHGFTPKTELISFQRHLPNEEEVATLGLKAKDEVVTITRLRKADNTAICLDTTTLPMTVLPDQTLIGGSLYEYLEKIGKPVVRALQRHKAAIADAELSRLLNVAVGEPLGLVTRIGYTGDDEVVELTRTYCVNDYYEFVVELKR